MKSETYFKVLSKQLSKSIVFLCLPRKLGLYNCPVNFPCLFPELLTSINQTQRRIPKCVPSPHALCQHENRGVPHPGKPAVLQGPLFSESCILCSCFLVCEAPCEQAERLRGLLVVEQHQPGHQGALILCPLVGVTRWGSPLLFPGLHIDTSGEAYRCLLREVFLQHGLSRVFIRRAGGVGWYSSVREKHSFKFL